MLVYGKVSQRNIKIPDWLAQRHFKNVNVRGKCVCKTKVVPEFRKTKVVPEFPRKTQISIIKFTRSSI